MHSYDYPKVRPPSSMAPIERHTSQTGPLRSTHRQFSWMQTPIEAKGQAYPRDSQIPPLPQIPAHLTAEAQSHQHQEQQQQPQQPHTTIPEPQTAQTQYPQDIKENMYHSQSWRSATETQTPQYEPLPIKSPVTNQPERYVVPPIGPDENPLTPKIPSRAYTTNMSVLSPTTPNHAPFAAPAQVVSGGTWSHDICSCVDPTTCLTSLFCPCIIYGKTQYRLTQRAAKKDPTNMLGYSAINGSCAAFAILCGINGILAAIQHTRVRKTYSMNHEAGNVFSDCLKGCCCCCCTIAQDEKEVKKREDTAKGPETQYQTPGGMVFAPPPR